MALKRGAVGGPVHKALQAVAVFPDQAKEFAGG